MPDAVPAWARLIRDVQDFPQPGVLFKDITTLIKDGAAYRQIVQSLLDHYREQRIDCVVGVESRGFIFACPLAYELGAGFVPVRKPGKLPADVLRTEYALEYGTNVLEVHKDAIAPGQRVLVVDDVLATGGSAEATIKLVEQMGGAVIGVAVVIELSFLKGRERLKGYDLLSLVTY
jgi:adenine phosphoribosyltransferase